MKTKERLEEEKRLIELEKLKKDLNYWQNEFKPVNNMGKWGRQVRVDSINKALEAAEAEQYDKERDILKSNSTNFDNFKL
jgi:hypothetical protein